MAVKKTLKKLARWLGRLVLAILSLLVIVLLLLQTNFAKQFLKNQAVSYLSKKLHTKVSIGELSINWLTNIQLDDIYLEDQQKNPLLKVGKLKADYKLLDLLHNQLTITNITLDSSYVHLSRPADDSTFNFDFIGKAFSSKTDEAAITDTATSSGTTMKMVFGKLGLTSTHFIFDDGYGGQFYEVAATSINAGIREFEPGNLVFKLDYLYTDGLSSQLKLGPGKDTIDTVKDKKESQLPFISVDSILLSSTNVDYKDANNNIGLQTNATKIGVSAMSLDLNKMLLKANYFSLDDHKSSLLIASKAKPGSTGKTKDTTATVTPFTFHINTIAINNNEIKYDGNATLYQPKTNLDYDHLYLKQLGITIHDLHYDGMTYAAGISRLTAQEQSGFIMKKFASNLIYSDTLLQLAHTFLETNNSSLQADIITRNSFNDIPNLGVKGTIRNSIVNLKDALFFAPDLAKNKTVQPLLGKNILINGNVTGVVKDLTINPVIIREGATLLNATAKVTGLPEVDKMKIELFFNEFSGTRESLLSWLPPNTLPPSVRIPDRFTLKGSYKGSLNDLTVDMKLVSSDGNLQLKGNMKDFSDSKKATYDMQVVTDNVRLDRILRDTSFGITTVNLHIKGKGFDPQTANNSFEGDVKKLKLAGYTYSDATIKGTISNQVLETELDLNDPNATGTIALQYGLDPTHPTLKTSGQLLNINLQKLGFTKEEILINTNLTADFASLDPKKLQGNAFLSNSKLSYNGKIYDLDSISIIADHQDNKQFLSISSPVLNATVNGNYELARLSTALLNVINHHIDPDFKAPSNPVLADVEIKGNFHYQDFLQSFVPELKEVEDVSFNGSMNSANNQLNFTLVAPFIRYGDFSIDSFRFITNTLNDILRFETGVKKLVHPKFLVNRDIFYGAIQKGMLNWNADFLDEDDQYRYKVNGSFYNGEEKMLHLGKQLVLNRQTWYTNEDNKIQILPSGNFGGNLVLTDGDHSLKITSNNEKTFPVELSFTKFPIDVATKIIQMDSTLVNGFITGKVNFEKIKPFTFSSHLTIDSITSYTFPVGTITSTVTTVGENKYALDLQLEGNGNHATVKGTYHNDDVGNFDASIGLHPFKLASVAPFVKDYLSQLTGTLSGDMALTGNLDKPAINGTLNIDSTSLVYNEYNTFISIPHNEIGFSNGVISLPNFVLYDSLKNKATIKGKIRTTNYRDYNLALTLNTKHFLAIQGQSRPEQKYYGPAFITSLINISGTSAMPDISGQVKVDDKSILTIVLPPDEVSTSNEEGIVKFVDKDADTLQVAGKIKDSTVSSAFTAVKLELNVEVTPTSTLKIIMDEDNGDYLSAKGTAALSVVMNRDGRLLMIGDYLVEEGEYELSMSQLIKRKFKIQKGSTIKWDGSPTGAEMNITAIYTANTTAAELVANQQNTINPVALNKQKIPFQVYLTLQEEMLHPKVSFKLDMNEKDQNLFNGIVYSKLKQINLDESQLNKQVMSLLAINRFITDDPLASLTDIGRGNSFSDNVETKARATAGKMLTQQLNNFASQIIKGFDINFDLDSKTDYSSGKKEGQTDLGINISKQLFNERIAVSVGSSFAVEGSDEYKKQAAGFGGDISLEYKITKDGRYRLKFYRRNSYEAALIGQVIETGASFVIVMDFDKFKEIFRKKKEEEITEPVAVPEKENKKN